jgi:hypothetical protein
MLAACKTAQAAAPTPGAMYVHLTTNNVDGKTITAIFRRIGADVLPDGSPHPAPWARLDRQFLVKLQGEDGKIRKASPDEIRAVEDFEKWVGRDRFLDDPPRKLFVDALMSDTVRTARLALGRHARRALFAFNLTATSRVRPGGCAETLDETTRRALLIDTLVDWHALASDDRWDDPIARRLWNSQLAPLACGFEVVRRKRSSDGSEPTKAERKKEEDGLRQRLEPLVDSIAGNPGLTRQVHGEWATRWDKEDHEWHEML